MKIVDGEHQYYHQLILTSIRIEDVHAGLSLARKYMQGYFGDETRQDRNDANLFWDKGDVRNAGISGAQLLTAPEFDFLKHFLEVESVQ